MPLLEMSPNVQEAEGGRKRSHDEYAGMEVLKANGPEAPSNPAPSRVDITPDSPQSPASRPDKTAAAPARTSPSPNTVQDRPAPTTASPEPNPAQKTALPPAKRKRLTPAEKAAKADEEAKKKQEREDARQQKLAEKARQEAEKQAAKAARQAEKAKKEEAEQEAKAAKQQERDEKRRKKEDEERKVREEKERKARSQLKLQSFFGKPSTPKKVAPSPVTGDEEGSPSVAGSAKKEKREKTEYERLFKPFFKHEHVSVARPRPWLDDEAAETKARILDECVRGERADAPITPFKPLEALQLPTKPQRRGRAHPPVRGIMEELQSNPSALGAMKGIPMKLICFRQDVRPPYCGTLTSATHAPSLARAARRPNRRVLELQYDYDSEAEWQDDEPGDDLDDLDDEEEELDDEDDMDGFLDDSEDAGVARRLFANGMEPVSTGVCWDDGGGGPADLKPYRMEVMLEGIDPSAGIDPTSTAYWSPPRKQKPPTSTSTTTTTTSKTTAATNNNAFEALKTSPDAPKPQPQITKPELLPDFKAAVLANRKLSKLAIVEVLGVQFEGLSKAETKAMLELVAEKGAGRGKVWELREG